MTAEKFKIKITQHAEALGPVRWWYWNKIGQEFEAWEDPERDIYFYVDANSADGITRPHHVLKTDCEVKQNEHRRKETALQIPEADRSAKQHRNQHQPSI
jgi:hypothetical protein